MKCWRHCDYWLNDLPGGQKILESSGYQGAFSRKNWLVIGELTGTENCSKPRLLRDLDLGHEQDGIGECHGSVGRRQRDEDKEKCGNCANGNGHQSASCETTIPPHVNSDKASSGPFNAANHSRNQEADGVLARAANPTSTSKVPVSTWPLTFTWTQRR